MSSLSDVLTTRSAGYWGVEAGGAEVDAKAIRNGDVGTSGELRWRALPWRGYTAREFTKARVHAGDIVLTTSGNCGNVAYVGIEPEDPTVATNFVRVLRTDPTVTDSRYVFHFLRTPTFASAIAPFVRGATIKNLAVESAFAAINIPLPPLSEQRRVAAILDHAEAICTKRRQVLAHLDSLTGAVFQEMFRDAPGTTPMSAVVEEFRYGTSNKSGDSGYPALRIPNVVGGAIDTDEIKTVLVEPAELRRLTLREGDLLFVRTNGNQDNVGRSAIFSEAAVKSAGFEDLPWIYASYLIRARLSDEIEPQFVAGYLATPAGREQLRERSKTSAGQYNINTEALGSIRLPTAPPAAQQEFASRVDVIEEKRKQVSAAGSADAELFASLQSHAFRGEL
ncbi:MAG: restriction endonuclease subunit S [Actinomycetota bacterium]|nr:MAG: restriction endonuclease subunit S [Actinomycetota bacterium]